MKKLIILLILLLLPITINAEQIKTDTVLIGTTIGKETNDTALANIAFYQNDLGEFGITGTIENKIPLKTNYELVVNYYDLYNESKLDLKELTALAIATSIDALAVGVAFALTYEKKQVFVAVALIGIITAVLSAIGVFIGHKFGAKYKNKAELAGGLVLVFMGVKFLLEGIGIIGG